jgi:16S rRNA processing protein RimM
MPESSSWTERADRVLVGVVGKAHGLNGHVFVLPESDNPQRFSAGSTMFVDERPVTVVASRVADGRLIVHFSGVDDRNAAESLRDARLTISGDERRALEDEEWWPEDLVGLRVLDHQGVERGVVVGVEEGVAQDRLVVRTAEGAVVEIPFVAALVPEVHIAAGHVRLAAVEGLLSES